MKMTTIGALILMAGASQACITPRHAHLTSGAKTFDSGDVHIDRPLELIVADDHASAELRDGEQVVTLTLERRADPDTWNVSCGQHYLEETFDVVAPERVTLDGRIYRTGALTANCGGPGAGSVVLYLDDVGNSRLRRPVAGEGDLDTMLIFRDPDHPRPQPLRPGAGSDAVSSSP